MASKGMKSLQEWCRRNTEGYNNVNVTNMTSAWKDGLAFCALIHHFRPDLIDFESLSKENVLYNNELAFSIAERELDIAALLDAEDMANMRVPDKLSIVTYLSQYYNHFKNHNLNETAKYTQLKSNPENIMLSSPSKKNLTEENVCFICQKHVHLVQRYFDNGKLCHRTCHRNRHLKEFGKNSLQSSVVNEDKHVQEGKIHDNSAKKDSETNIEKDRRIENSSDVPNETLGKSRVSDLNLPNLVECLSDATAHPIKITISDPSPVEVQGDSLISVSNETKSMISELPDSTVTEKDHQYSISELEEVQGDSLASVSNESKSMTSELPNSKITEKDHQHSISKPITPKPRSIHLIYTTSTYPREEVDAMPKEKPTAIPRQTNIPIPKDEDIKSSVDSVSYDNSLNPFGPGSDSNTTLSSESSEEGLNPFELEMGSDSDTDLSSSSSDEEYGLNPFETESKTIDKKENECEIREEDIKGSIKVDSQSQHVAKPETKVRKNPFHSVHTDESVKVRSKEVGDDSGFLNPFSTALKEETNSAKKKKRMAPVPPASIASPKAPSPAQRSTFATPSIKSSPVPSPNKTALNEELSRARTKKQAPSKPPEWKLEVAKKMIEVNKANATDPKYTKIQTKESAANTPVPAAVGSRFQTPAEKKKDLSKNITPSASPSKHLRSQRQAPGHGYPLVKRRVQRKMTEEQIETELKLLDIRLSDMETKGVKLEEMLRFAMEKDMEWTKEEDELLQEWFELVNKKNILLRMETDLVFLMQQQKLEQEHADIEFRLRKILNKPDNSKTDQDKAEEEILLKRLLEIVERRNIIVNSIEEERIKEAEEDAAYGEMKRLQNKEGKKKQKKVKRIFSKRSKKDKKRKEKQEQS